MIHLIFVSSSNTWKKRQTQKARSSKQCCSVIRVCYVHGTLSTAEHARVIESGVVSSSLWRFYQCLDSTDPFSSTCLTPAAPVAPVCAVALYLPFTASEPGRQHYNQMCVSINTNKTRQTNLLELAIWPEAFRQTTQLSLSLFWTVPLYIKWP